MDLGLHGKTVVITGALGDLGSAMARAFAQEGANILGADLAEEGAAWVREIHSYGVECSYLSTDVRDRSQADALMSAALEHYGRLDVVLSNAGVAKGIPFLDVTEEEWRWHLDTNLTGGFHIGQAAARIMVQEGTAGKIIFTGSWVQDIPWPEDGPYCASKGGLKMLAKVMARELAASGIRVNLVAPGIVKAGVAARQLATEPQYEARATKSVPLGELGTPEQVATAVLYLASEAADYMTGATLLIDGGASLYNLD